MKLEDKVPKRRVRINFKPIITLIIGLGVFSAILILTLIEAAKDVTPAFKLSDNKTGNLLAQSGQAKEKQLPYADYDSEMLAVVTKIDIDNKQITLFNIIEQETSTLYYSGGSDIKDKFGQVISMNQVPIGMMADIGYQKMKNKLIRLAASEKTWEYIGVNNLSVNRADRIMKIAKTKYKFTDDILVLDQDKQKSVEDLALQDELTVRGYGETIWSITVTKGHGTVKLVDYEDFLGGSVTVGYEAMQQITGELTITVREGNFNLTVENGIYSGTKNVTVKRNEETVVSLSDLGPKAGQHGLVTFQINPYGADVKIDGKLVSYENAIELAYGDHKIEVSLGGYTTYKGILSIDTAGKKIKIDLPEAASRDKVNVVETGTSETDSIKQEYNDWNYPSINTNQGGSGEDDSSSQDEFIVDEEHSIYVQSPVGASVYLNGEFMGISPGKFQKVIGSHVLTFIKAGYETMSYPVEIEDDGLDTYFSFSELGYE